MTDLLDKRVHYRAGSRDGELSSSRICWYRRRCRLDGIVCRNGCRPSSYRGHGESRGWVRTSAPRCWVNLLTHFECTIGALSTTRNETHLAEADVGQGQGL